MPKNSRDFVPNQVFVGLPWNFRSKYDPIVAKLERKYPLHFAIVGRNDSQDADDLFAIIKERISSSSYAIFDATGGDANVSLEFGYAEALEIRRAIYLNVHKAQKRPPGLPIISDLGGKRRVQYKSEKELTAELDKQARRHDYTVRFESALAAATKGKAKGVKKSARSLALKVVHALDVKVNVRRADLVQQLQAGGYRKPEIDAMLRNLHRSGLVMTSKGRYADVTVA